MLGRSHNQGPNMGRPGPGRDDAVTRPSVWPHASPHRPAPTRPFPYGDLPRPSRLNAGPQPQSRPKHGAAGAWARQCGDQAVRLAPRQPAPSRPTRPFPYGDLPRPSRLNAGPQPQSRPKHGAAGAWARRCGDQAVRLAPRQPAPSRPTRPFPWGPNGDLLQPSPLLETV